MTAALRTLLREVVDYAGLFPPAGLPMRDAVAEYARHRAGPDAWMLGRFVAPVTRLAEWEEAARDAGPRDWRLAVLAPSVDAALERTLTDFNAAHAGSAVADAVEVKAARESEVPRGATVAGAPVYVEVPISDDPAPFVAAIGRAGARAKVRTGGVTADAFPSAAEVARFIRRCVEHGVPFKATAGLHHPLRAEYRLTYASDAPRGTMFGFLNVLLATLVARAGGDARSLIAALEEKKAREIVVGDDAIEWRGMRFGAAEIAAARGQGMFGFGSCSFREPVDDLRSIGLL
ncbi:MAG TPA: hypothetical protein VHM67_03360 [Gemmatimonadaceae bacterium]|nr:hypothetical protein [Gemmatimonadaceae bacterium]